MSNEVRLQCPQESEHVCVDKWFPKSTFPHSFQHVCGQVNNIIVSLIIFNDPILMDYITSKSYLLLNFKPSHSQFIDASVTEWELNVPAFRMRIFLNIIIFFVITLQQWKCLRSSIVVDTGWLTLQVKMSCMSCCGCRKKSKKLIYLIMSTQFSC